MNTLEIAAATPNPIIIERFNPAAYLPYGCEINHVQNAMREFCEFLALINQNLVARDIQRLESLLMPANFSSMVGEFTAAGIAKYCPTLVKNQYHNGHPDLIPADQFPDDAVRYTSEGIEIKASRYFRGWQGHNPENVWLMIFIFESNRPSDATKHIAPKPFQFRRVIAAPLLKEDWLFAGRSETSRRTITASITPSGYDKLMANWIYNAPT